MKSDDAAPGPLGGGVQQEVNKIGTDLLDKGAPKTP